MSKYETYLEEIENGDGNNVSEEAYDAAADCLAFVTSLHSVFRDNGYDLPEDPDVSSLENILDSMMGELAAASLFLSEDAFASVPTMLRNIATAFGSLADGEETDDVEKVVPTVIVNGYNNLAKRIEATRVQQQQMKDLLEAQTK